MRKKIIIIIGILLLIFFGVSYQNRKVRKEFNLFYSSQLSGKISAIQKNSRASNFMLDNNPNDFDFYPYTNKQLNNNEIFQYIAELGDSIFKPAYSDTLILIKKGKKYMYKFQKM